MEVQKVQLLEKLMQMFCFKNTSGNNVNELNYMLDIEETLDMGNYMINFYG